MKQISVSLVALALAVSSVSAAFDVSKGGQLGRAHHARAHHDASVNGRRATTGKAAYCAAKNATTSALSVAIEAVTTSTTSTVEPEKTTTTPKAEPTTTKADPPKTTPKAEPTTTKADPPKTTTKAATSSSGGGGKTYSGGDMTFYTPGLNACGTTDGPNSYIAAVPHGLWNNWPGFNGNSNQHPLCHKAITVTYNGKSVGVTITDMCEGCDNENSLDLAPKAFAQLASYDAGRVNPIEWQFA